MKIRLLIICCLYAVTIRAQTTNSMNSSREKNKNTAAKVNLSAEKKYNTLFQYGIADAFVGGVFEATLPITELKKHGDFGLGAPGVLDGELIISDGHAFQTRATGITAEVSDAFKTALAFVTFFQADTAFHIRGIAQQQDAFRQIEQHLNKKNAVYAIRISGNFDDLKTRAFPPYTQKPFPPLATLLDRQKFFDIKNTKGQIIGYKLPPYLNGISIEGYHFHFLSDSKTQGGHVLNFGGDDLIVEIAEIKSFVLSLPQDDAFMNYNFKTGNKGDLEKVEKGH